MQSLSSVVFAALALAAVGAQPAEPTAPPSAVVRSQELDVLPQWSRQPTQEELEQAMRTHAPGFLSMAGRLRCEVASTGMLENCEVTEIAPDDPRARAAVLAVAPYMRMSPGLQNGAAVRTVVVIPVRLESGMSVGSDGRPNRRRAGAGKQAATTPPTTAPRDDDPVGFVILPTADDMAAAYPPLAYRENLPGDVRLRCGAAPDGRL